MGGEYIECKRTVKAFHGKNFCLLYNIAIKEDTFTERDCIMRYYLSRFLLLLIFLILLPGISPAQEKNFKDRERKDVSSENAAKERKDEIRSVFTVTPPELNLGIIGMGEGSKASLVIKNGSSRVLKWYLIPPEGWSAIENKKIFGLLKKGEDTHVTIHVSSLKLRTNHTSSAADTHLVQLSFEMESQISLYRKNLTNGTYRNTVLLKSDDGVTKDVVLKFELVPGKREPLLRITPERIDLGMASTDEEITKKITVTNPGQEALRWRATCDMQPVKNESPKKGRYVSFLNTGVKGSSVYSPPLHVKEYLDCTGKWYEKNGYPWSSSPHSMMRYRFKGTGIGLFLYFDPGEGAVRAYVDDDHSNAVECNGEIPGAQVECIVAENLPHGHHILSVMNGSESPVLIEGVKVYGHELKQGSPGWIKIFPDSGVTTRETDYVTITVNTRGLNPGVYGADIMFTSNGGEKNVEVSLEVKEEAKRKVIDIYRFVSGSDYLFTDNPDADPSLVRGGGYKKQGIAFRLFSPGTPGTTPFHRWYNVSTRCHFYSHDIREGKSSRGYIYEGTIGNIATSRLSNTKELYRWYNPVTGSYFLTTDPKGEGGLKKGYRFDGIAGYVR